MKYTEEDLRKVKEAIEFLKEYRDADDFILKYLQHTTDGGDNSIELSLHYDSYRDLVIKYAEEMFLSTLPTTSQGERKSAEGIDELWDKHHEMIGDSIDDAQFYSGKNVITKENFYKALESFASQFLPSAGEVTDFEEVQTLLNKNFDNIRMGAEHTLFLNERFEVRDRLQGQSKQSDESKYKPCEHLRMNGSYCMDCGWDRTGNYH